MKGLLRIVTCGVIGILGVALTHEVMARQDGANQGAPGGGGIAAAQGGGQGRGGRGGGGGGQGGDAAAQGGEQGGRGGRGGGGMYGALRIRNVGPAMISGRIQSIAVDPTNKRHYFIAAASGGVWRTNNGGDHVHSGF